MTIIKLNETVKEVLSIHAIEGCTSIFEAIKMYVEDNDDDLEYLRYCLDSDYLFERMVNEGLSKEEQHYLLHNAAPYQVNNLYNEEMLSDLEPKELFDFFNDQEDHFEEALCVLIDNPHLIDNENQFHSFIENQMEALENAYQDEEDYCKCIFDNFNNKMPFNTVSVFKEFEQFEELVKSVKMARVK